MYRVCIILWDGAIIGVYTKEKIINTYPPLFIQAHRNGAVGLNFSFKYKVILLFCYSKRIVKNRKEFRRIWGG